MKEIEQCREELIRLSANNSLTSDVVIHMSQKLDEALNQYQIQTEY